MTLAIAVTIEMTAVMSQNADLVSVKLVFLQTVVIKNHYGKPVSASLAGLSHTS
jgi:hypothetical protein